MVNHRKVSVVYGSKKWSYLPKFHACPPLPKLDFGVARGMNKTARANAHLKGAIWAIYARLKKSKEVNLLPFCFYSSLAASSTKKQRVSEGKNIAPKKTILQPTNRLLHANDTFKKTCFSKKPSGKAILEFKEIWWNATSCFCTRIAMNFHFDFGFSESNPLRRSFNGGALIKAQTVSFFLWTIF